MTINLYIILAVLFVLSILIGRKSGVVITYCVVSILFLACIWIVPLDYLRNLSFLTIEESGSVDVDKSGSFTVEGNVLSFVVKDDYTVTAETTLESLNEWKEKQNKNIKVYVKSGDSIVYSKNLGFVSTVDMQEVLDLYKRFKSSGNLPSEKVRISYGAIYVDR